MPDFSQPEGRLFIDGAWVESSTEATIDVIDSGTEEVYYRVAAAGPDDIARAVGAARYVDARVLQPGHGTGAGGALHI